MKKIIAMFIITALLLAACAVRTEESSLIDGDSSLTENNSSPAGTLSEPNEKDTSDLIDKSDIEDSSEPKEYVTTTEIDKTAYEYKTIYTEKIRLDGIFPFGSYIDSYKEFDEYNYCSEEEKNNGEEYHTIDELFNIDQSVGNVPSYREWIKKYDSGFFEENGLIILVVEAEKGIVPKVDSLCKRSDGYINACVDGCGYTEKEQQVYHIFIEIPKAEMGEYRNKHDVVVYDTTDEPFLIKIPY